VGEIPEDAEPEQEHTPSRPFSKNAGIQTANAT